MIRASAKPADFVHATKGWRPNPDSWLLVALLVACVAANSAFVPYYFSLSNLLDATRAGGELGLLGLGMTVVMLIGGIDLSIGSIFALSAMIMGIAVKGGVGLPAAIVLGLATGICAGAVNGLIVTRLRLPPIVVTLATMAVYRGMTVGISGGESYPIPDTISFLGQGSIAGIPTQLILLLVLTTVTAFVLRHTTYGLFLQAIGTNETAAGFAAIPVALLKVSVYAISGLFCALASLVYVSRVVSAKADFGIGYELDAVTVAVLGGATLSGGRANVVGTVIAVMLIVFLRRGLTMAFVGTDIQTMIIGAILIVAVAARNFGSLRQAWRRRRRGGPISSSDID
ncbi:MAG: ABC transporter permease [Rhizobiales bacterium]|nr:ABC transporter permease [Hyphomicrobiales bacterium]